MTAIAKHLVETWPGLKRKQWPAELGPQPSAEAVRIATAVARPDTATAMALAMYARPQGATDRIAAEAATLATGSLSKTQRAARDALIQAGALKALLLGEERPLVTRISLPAKGKRKAAAK